MHTNNGNGKAGFLKRLCLSIMSGLLTALFLTMIVAALENAEKIQVQGKDIWPILIRGLATMVSCLICLRKGGGVGEIGLCAAAQFALMCIVTLLCFGRSISGIPEGAASAAGGMVIAMIVYSIRSKGKKKNYKRKAYC